MINKNNNSPIIGMIAIIAVIVFVIAVESANCDGTLVRGLIWFECIRDAS